MENKNKVYVGIGIIIMIFVFISLPIIAQTSEYQKPIYKVIEHKNPIYESVYKTVEHNEPKYETVYTYQIDYTIVKNVYDIKKEYTGKNFWGTNEYKVTVCYYDTLSKKTKTFYEVVSWDIVKKDTYEAIVGYNTWIEQILDGQEIVGYDKWTETVIDRYATMRKIEYKSIFEIMF